MDQRLSVFVAVVEQQSFSRAALKQHLTQPAASQQVRALERELGARLLERTNKFLRLTPAGEIVYEHARQMLEIEGRMRRYVDDLRGGAKGPLAIGASYTIGEYLLPRVLAPFQATYPQVLPAVTIANTQHIAELVAGRHLDLGLIEGSVGHSGLEARPILEDSLCVVAAAGHPLVRQSLASGPLVPAALAEHTWLVREAGSGTRAVTDAFFADNALTPTTCLAFGSTQMIKEAVEAGMGLSLLSSWTIRKEVALGTLAQVPVVGTPRHRPFLVVTPRSQVRAQAVEVFVRELDGRLAGLATAMQPPAP